jgi:hypothetical protein
MTRFSLRYWWRRMARSSRCGPVPGRPGRHRTVLELEALPDRLLLSVFAVINNADSGEGSLRQAILDANAHPGSNTVIFDIPGAGAHTIQPVSPLPTITNPLVLDATYQPGYAGTPLIELDGSQAGILANGLMITANDSVVRGLVVNRFVFAGVRLQGSGDRIEGCYLGTDVSGTQRLGNGEGVEITGTGDLIGGPGAGAGNLISGNAYGVDIVGNNNQVQGNTIGSDVTGTQALLNTFGVLIAGGTGNLVGGTGPGAGNLISGNVTGVHIGGNNNQVQGNTIGTDMTGTQALGNTDGVFIQGGTGNLVGGTGAGAGNLISGNSIDGVGILGGNNNQVQGNIISTDVTGTQRLRNNTGVFIQGGTGNLVGGTAAGAGNLISGNSFYGVYLFGDNNLVQGNSIGTDISGTQPLGNGTGIYTILRSHNLIGGTEPGAGNTIAFNSGPGVLVDNGTGNAIRQNAIFANGGPGIRLTNGGNHGQPAPVLQSASSDRGLTTVSGTLTAAPNTTFVVELFINTVCDPTGFGQGEQFFASLTVTTNASGTAFFTVTVAVAVDPGRFVTATATDPGGNTSEFSACMIVAGPAPAPSARNGFSSENDLSGTVIFDPSGGPPRPWGVRVKSALRAGASALIAGTGAEAVDRAGLIDRLFSIDWSGPGDE